MYVKIVTRILVKVQAILVRIKEERRSKEVFVLFISGSSMRKSAKEMGSINIDLL